MISDVLVEALERIEEHEANQPEAYGTPDMKARLATVKAAMRELLVYLDTPPAVDASSKKEMH